MTRIENFHESYYTLSRIYLIQSDFKSKFIGFYDSVYGKEWNMKYSHRLFFKKNGVDAYDDIYKGKDAIELSFIHYPLGNGIGKNIRLGAHTHTKIFVSTNNIKLSDVYTVDNNDIFFYADMESIPKTLNGGSLTLYELTPHMSPEELQRMKESTGEVVKIKEQLIKTESEKKQLEADLFFEQTRALAASGCIISYQQHTDALLKFQKELVNRVKSVSLGEAHLMNESIKDLEKKFDMNRDWSGVANDLVSNKVNDNSAFNEFIQVSNELATSNVSEEMKNILIEKVVNICGIDKVKETIIQMESLGVSKIPATNMTALNMKYLDDVQNGKIRPEEAKYYMNNSFDELKNRSIQNNDINSSLEEINKNRDIVPKDLSMQDILKMQKELMSKAR